MLFASQVFVRIEIKHFLPIEFLRLPAVPINLAVIVLCPRLTMRHLLYHAREVLTFNVQQMILVVCMILYTNRWQYCQNVRAIIWFDGIVLTLHGKSSISIGFT